MGIFHSYVNVYQRVFVLVIDQLSKQTYTRPCVCCSCKLHNYNVEFHFEISGPLGGTILQHNPTSNVLLGFCFSTRLEKKNILRRCSLPSFLVQCQSTEKYMYLFWPLLRIYTAKISQVCPIDVHGNITLHASLKFIF